MELVTRLLIALGISLVGMGLYWGWNLWHLARLRRRAASRLHGLEGLRPGIPAILYFTTPDCLPCRTVQRPALERLQADLAGGVQIVEVDASAQRDLADYWGVLSVPTTFIIDASGQPRRVNHGVTSAEKLKQQVEEMSQGPRAKGTKTKTSGTQSALGLEP
jgi:thioredoxin 1